MFASLQVTDLQSRLETSLYEPAGPYPTEAPFPTELLQGEPRPAAVLMPLLRHQDDWHLLFTRRNAALAEHSGQVAFPGGRADAEDASPEATALREAYEEVGIHPSDVQVIGRLRSFLTITNYLVTPVVGLIPWPYTLRLQIQEVSRAFTIPLSWLADPGNYEEKIRQLPPPYAPVPVVLYKTFDQEILWGATARFTLTLIDLLMRNGSENKGG